MKWRKLGRIFNPYEHSWNDEYIGYAQSPQTILFENFVRIYFSIRKKDATQKFLSHIQYVDFELDMKTIRNFSNHEVFGPGNLGCFDEHGVFPLNVLRVKDKIYGYSNGWSRRVSVSVETGIGFAVSHDNGETFNRIGEGPIMSATTHEPVLVGDPFVQIFDGIFHMWYLFGVGWKKYSTSSLPERIYKIAHATSYNGIDWIKEEGIQIIPDKLNEDECQALPSVIFHQNRYYMCFCYRDSTGFRKSKKNGYRLGFAYSDNLKEWTRDDEKVDLSLSIDEWDSDMQCYPHLFRINKKVYLLYNGNEFGKYGFGLAELIN
jgi:hypothetical protein